MEMTTKTTQRPKGNPVPHIGPPQVPLRSVEIEISTRAVSRAANQGKANLMIRISHRKIEIQIANRGNQKEASPPKNWWETATRNEKHGIMKATKR